MYSRHVNSSQRQTTTIKTDS